MKSKDIRVKMTNKQLDALHTAADQAGVSISDIVRSCLIKNGIIPDDEIQHGGYRERKAKNE